MIIKIGDFVKVAIYENGGVEKLWFEVVFIDLDNTFIGRCDNYPIAVTSANYNENYKFNINQIIEKI